MSFGIVGVYGKNRLLNAAKPVFDGLSMLHHRIGKEYPVISTNMTSGDGPFSMYGYGENGFADIDLEKLNSDTSYIGIGRISDKSHHGPSIANSSNIAVVGNGKLTNSDEIKKMYYKDGSSMKSDASSSDILIYLACKSGKNKIKDALVPPLGVMVGSYCFNAIIDDNFVAVRDGYGYRPLSLGRLPDGSYAVASETVSLDRMGARYERDVGPGELIIITEKDMKSFQLFESNYRHCSREPIYFLNGGSLVFGGRTASDYRRESGAAVAQENEDVLKHIGMVSPLNESATDAALGIHDYSKIDFIRCVLEMPEGQRIAMKEQKIRGDYDVKGKVYVNRHLAKGRNIALVSAAFLTGETAKDIAWEMLKSGARELHFFFPSPSPRQKCPYRESMKDVVELEGSETEAKDRALEIISDGGENPIVKSVNFLSCDKTLELTGKPDDFCYQCFTEKDLYDDI